MAAANPSNGRDVQSNEPASTTAKSPYIVLQVDRIPTRVTFHRLLNLVANYSRHVTGVARTADYTAKRLGTTVFFYCTDASDALFLEQQHIQFVNDGRDAQRLKIVDLVVGVSSIENRLPSVRYNNVPVSVCLRGLQRYRDDTESSTEYLMSLVPYFENQGLVTSIKLGYDPRKKATRSDGFLTYLNQRDAREIAGEIDPKYHVIHDQRISAVLSNNVPILLKEEDAGCLEKGRKPWASELLPINKLIVKHEEPFVHRPNQLLMDIQAARTERNLQVQEYLKATVGDFSGCVVLTASGGTHSPIRPPPSDSGEKQQPLQPHQSMPISKLPIASFMRRVPQQELSRTKSDPIPIPVQPKPVEDLSKLSNTAVKNEKLGVHRPPASKRQKTKEPQPSTSKSGVSSRPQPVCSSSGSSKAHGSKADKSTPGSSMTGSAKTDSSKAGSSKAGSSKEAKASKPKDRVTRASSKIPSNTVVIPMAKTPPPPVEEEYSSGSVSPSEGRLVLDIDEEDWDDFTRSL